MKSMGWTDKHTLQQIDPDRQSPTNGHAAELLHGDESPPTLSDQQQLKPASFLPPMKCCCSKCCCNCGLLFRDEHDVGTNAAANKHRPKPAHPSRKTSNQGLAGNGNHDHSSGGNGGVELVPLLARRRAKQQAVALSTTDVTKLPAHPAK